MPVNDGEHSIGEMRERHWMNVATMTVDECEHRVEEV
jgi:hypothetical protein